MSKRILITGTRAPVALELARSFAAVGHTVLAAESQWPNLGEASRAITQNFKLPKPRLFPLEFARALNQLVQSERIDLVIPTCEEVFFVAHAASLSGRPERYFLPSLETLDRLHNKWAFVQLAEELGLQVPQTWLLISSQDLNHLPKKKLFLKPVYSRFASRAVGLEVGQALPELPIAETQPWLAQAFIQGQELCSYSVAKAGKLTAHVAYRPKWRAGRGASIHFESVEHPGVLHFVETAVRQLNYTGQIAFDFIENEAGIWVLECNPRAVSGVHLLTPEAQVAAFLERGLAVAPAGRRANLGLAMWMFGLPAALQKGRLGEWWQDWRSAKEVISSPSDSRPGLHQLSCTAATLLEAYSNKTSPLQATTLDIEWNGEPLPTNPARLEPVEILQGQQIPDPILRELSEHRSTDLIANVQTQLRVVRQGETLLPISVQNMEAGNSFIASAYTHYVSYARAELRGVREPFLQKVLEGVLRGLGSFLRFSQIDRVVYVNNWLLSTCLYPALKPAQIRSITQALQRAFPDHAFVWRSVHAYGNDELKRALVDAGYRLVPSRSVLFYNAPRGDHRHKKDFKRDLKLLAETPYILRKLEHPTGAELERVQELYTLLYIKKYSPFNPQYTLKFMNLAQRSGLLEFYVLEKDGRIDGAMGLYCRGGYMAAPVFGYDTALPKELGLYRLLSTHLTLEAERRGLVLHASSGVAKFKRSRGATPELEWIGVNDGHLPLRRRLGWGVLEFLMGEVAVPLIRKMGL